MKKIILAVIAVVMFSGCSRMALKTANAYTQEQQLDEYTTYICYDLFEKKDCPHTLLQVDLDIVPIIPFDSRFCIGFSREIEVPNGMYCFHKNIIK